ncbi:outer membrane protein [Helicobacter salomonis]|uniref:OMP533 n=1 Tax=Helicobacter salomonis TaxID=56878 RepID=A0A1M4NIF0_9HELI|nr:outer membrane protein [Helicobacter salomonis]SFZ73072.1 OMP533 [Helicobacter salomonis]
MNCRLLRAVVVLVGLTGGLHAEKDGFYASTGFQYSLVKTTITGSFGVPEGWGISAGQSNMYGLTLQGGYKYFFGKGERRNGVRGYAFYSYGYDNPTFNGIRLNNNVYGVGADYLFDFLDNVRIQAGFFIGLGFAGSSWSTNRADAFKALLRYPNTAMNTSYFQVPMQWGLRVNMHKHHGFEMGVKIPLVRNYYFKTLVNGGVSGLTFQRSAVFFTHYVYNF